MKKKYTKAIGILTDAANGERMKASIGGSGSLAEAYCSRVAGELEAAILLLKSHEEEDDHVPEQ